VISHKVKYLAQFSCQVTGVKPVKAGFPNRGVSWLYGFLSRWILPPFGECFPVYDVKMCDIELMNLLEYYLCKM